MLHPPLPAALMKSRVDDALSQLPATLWLLPLVFPPLALPPQELGFRPFQGGSEFDNSSLSLFKR